MMELVDEADVQPAQGRAAGIVHLRCRLVGDIDFAAVRLFEQTRDMQQCRFAGPRRCDQRHRLARP